MGKKQKMVLSSFKMNLFKSFKKVAISSIFHPGHVTAND